MADNTLETGNNALPKDLAIVSQPDTLDRDKFKVVATGLKINSGYTFQFQYVYPDGAVSEWSPGYSLLTDLIATLPKPKLTSANISYFQGILNVTWDGTDFNNTPYGNGFSRILIWVRDNSTPGQLFKIIGELTKPGTWSLAVPPKSQTVKLSAVTVNGEESPYSDEFTITPVIAAPATPTGIAASWSGTDFTVQFTHDPSDSANEYLKEYLITLNTASSGTKIFSLLPVSGTSQKFSLSLPQNQAAFGTAVQAFSGNVQTVDIYGNKGSAGSFTNTTYVSALATPTITVAATTNGYTVTYPTQTSNTFKFISVEEVESNASTDPGTGYAGIATGSVNPIFVPAANTNKRWVRARLYDTLNTATGYSTAVAVTPLSPVTVDNDGPPNVLSVTTSGGLDNSGTIGFNGYADISWPAVTTGGIRGYRIRYRPITTPASNYSYADSPGSGTAYRLSGLGAGLTYEIAVATYDEYNNTSTNYVSGTNVTVGGTPYVASTVDVTGYFSAKANPTDPANTAFKFGYGVDTGKRGLVFNTNNYWYIDSDQTALLKVGGSTTNYIEWNGSSFVIDGDLRAKKGSFSGNVNMASGASIYSGTLTGNTVTATGDTGGSLNGAGYILNSSGLTFSSATVSGITTIDASTGLFTTSSANIGGWLISPSTNVGSLYKTSGTNTVKLDSTAGAVVVSGTGYTSGIGLPDANNIVFWAGSSRAESANFWVKQDGSVKLGSVTITGYATSSDLTSGLGTKINTGGAATDVNNNITTISGGKIRTGSIQSTTWSGTVTNGSDYSTSGMNINLDNAGSITAKNFRIDESGNAFFKGTLSSGISIDAPVITGGQINIGNGAFKVSTLGVLEATGAIISGNITATLGSIGGWLIGTSTLTGGTLTLNSTGTITSTGTATGFFGSVVNLSSTFSSGKISIYANESTSGWFSTNTDAGIRAYNNTNETYISPNGIRINAISEQLGVGVGGFSITHVAGDYDVHFNLTGASNVGSQTGRYIMFDHWKSGAGQRDKDNIMRTFDTVMAGIRSLKMYTDGRLYLGETQYFSTTQTSTPSAGTGENGDLFFSTA